MIGGIAVPVRFQPTLVAWKQARIQGGGGAGGAAAPPEKIELQKK